MVNLGLNIHSDMLCDITKRPKSFAAHGSRLKRRGGTSFRNRRDNGSAAGGHAGRRDRPGGEIRERIVGAARRYFLSHGFRRVTMNDLAAELGMSKKTLYAHFTSKTELLEAVLLANFCAIESELAAIAAASASDFVAGLHGLLACLQRHTAEIQPPFVRNVAARRARGVSVDRAPSP